MSSLAAIDIRSVTRNLREAVAACHSEEDLRVEMELILREAVPELPTPRYEKTVRASTFVGRADAVHTGLVIEYEKPGTMRRKTRREHAVKQVCEYLTALTLGEEAQVQSPFEPESSQPLVVYSQQQEEQLAANVGLATDGDQFIFVQRRAKRWSWENRKLDDDTIEKLLLWLRAMTRKDLSPEHLIADFGPQTELATNIVSVLAKLVDSGKHPKANVIYEEWHRIFGIVYGTEQLHRTQRAPEAKALTSAYDLREGIDFPVVLFAVHTYYALLMKMLTPRQRCRPIRPGTQ